MNRIYTTVQAAKMLRVSERRVLQIAEQKDVGMYVGGIWLYTEVEVKKMKKRHKKPGQPRLNEKR